ncbi:MAG TPA: glycosyl hydrolase family 18 protein [Cytophagaceae bacterium]|nr:glycosyl hydrolase family 18 protein [Cytophagaceae bacterium]
MKSTSYRKIYFILILAILSIRASAQFRVVGYLPNWGNLSTDASVLDYTKITHLNIAFLNPAAAGDLGPTTGLSSAVQYAHNSNVKILISLGGSNAPAAIWSNLLLDANRAAYITKIVGFVNTYSLDGVDIDLEGSSIDANYQKFVTDLKAALPAGILLTAAVATWEAGSFTNAALSQFDFINIMSYDATGTWSPGSPGQHSPYSMAVSDLNYWGTNRGIAKAKLSLGVPFYGYGFITSPVSAYESDYNTIVALYAGSENHDTVIVNTSTKIYYNGIPEIQDKTTLALNNAGGIMIWHLKMDAPGTKSLLTAINNVVQSSLNNIPPLVNITSANKLTFTESDIINLTANASDPDPTGSVLKVAFYAGSFKIGEDATAPYSINWYGAGSGTYYITAKAFDNQHAITTSIVDTVYVVPGTETPFGGSAWAIPGRIEAENYDMGGDNISYHDLDAGNNGGAYRLGSVDIEATSDAGGGYNIGWTQPGEWLRYTVNVTADSMYDIKVRVATTLSGKQFHIEMDGVNVTGNISVPNTGGWQNWQTVTIPNIALTSGTKIMKVAFDYGDFNLNYVDVTTHSLTLGTTSPVSSFTNFKVQPNPFNNTATISFSLANAGVIKIVVYNEIGKEVTTLSNGYLNAGLHEIPFNADFLNSGFYFCQIIQSNDVKMLKLIKE